MHHMKWWHTMSLLTGLALTIAARAGMNYIENQPVALPLPQSWVLLACALVGLLTLGWVVDRVEQ